METGSTDRTPLMCSVVVPTYNAAGTLDETLAALAEQTVGSSFEVVIADNRSSDASVPLALHWQDRLPNLRVVDAGRAQGVSAARNDGIAAAASDLVLICDADDVADRRWVENMTAALRTADFVGGALDTSHLNAASARDWMPLEPLTLELPRTWGGRAYAFGGNLGLRRKVWVAAGGFDETYGAGAEEIDFAWRAAEAGYVPAFVPEAVIHYRLRTDLRALVRQQHQSGLGTAQLYATFRPPEVAVRSWHRRIRHEIALLRDFPWRGDRTARGVWLGRIAFEAGVARGALRHRTAMP